ncbi:MAG: ThuA domain-containing protein [Halioglobus sp.]
MKTSRTLLPALVMVVMQFIFAQGGHADSSGETGAIKVLYVTSAGWFHDYQRQTELVTSGIGMRIDADFDVIVGDIERLRETDFAVGYDVLIYNFCHAARRDPQLVDNLIRPVRDQGVPLLAVHCAMHSFQHVSDWYELLGLKTLRHEDMRSFTLNRASEHPVTAALVFPWELISDELYINRAVGDRSEALISAYGVETEKHHLQAWLNEVNGTPVLATTLGHSEETLNDPQFQQFLANAVAFLAGKLDSTGRLQPSVACGDSCTVKRTTLTANVVYPSQEERSCVIKTMFETGIPRVENCEKICMTDAAATKAACTQQCQISEPWDTPESLWPNCSGAKEVPKNR